jgi:hypothetical protein
LVYFYWLELPLEPAVRQMVSVVLLQPVPFEVSSVPEE